MRKLRTEEIQRPELKDISQSKKFPICLVLDNIRSMHNVGSAFRTADALGVQHIHLCGITAQPPHRDINKTALGATDSVDWTYTKNISELLLSLKNEGYKIVLIEQTNKSHSLEDFYPEPVEKYAFVFGNEVFGLSEQSLQHADIAIEIPQYGIKHSFNVSVSMGIILWHYVMNILRN
ncbi:MAG: RNA methyltransferase [Bernardetiaceae bacterium]|nr:RNA methyltransferase [Bernardetiaceae bacterium]